MSKTLTERQYKNLITKSKQGWACYYRAETQAHRNMNDLYAKIDLLKNQIKGEDDGAVPEFMKNEITDLLKELKKEVECPICFDIMKSEDIKFSSCGHKYCETCLSKINECAICRKKIYRKNK